jgi:hypothetical protein
MDGALNLTVVTVTKKVAAGGIGRIGPRATTKR